MNSFKINGVAKRFSSDGSWRHRRERRPFKIGTGIFLFGLVLFVFTLVPAMAADYDYVEVNNPFLRKIPTAVPVFKTVTSGAAEKAIATDAADLLSGMLEFTGYFKMLDRSAFLSDPANPSIVAADIQFKNWSGIGAELLVTGGAYIEDEVLKLEMRLFDTFKGELLVGKRYVGEPEDQQRMVRRFCSEILYVLTGSRGVFDSKIAFVSTVGNHKEIFICDFDGSHPTQLTRYNSISLSPAWSSDGQWIAYTSYAKANPDLYIRHVYENRGTVVSRKGLNIAPSWVPGAHQLAATQSYEGNPEIYLLTGAGKMVRKLTNSNGIDVSATFSPDGRRMAFVSKRGGTPQIYIKDLTSGSVRRFTFSGKNNTQPSWSPKSDQIAYTSMEDGRFNIWIADINGNSQLQLTRGAGDNESPSWAPDGSMIVFSSTREGPSKIYLMTAFGTDQRKLINMKGRQSEPGWSPNAGFADK